MVDVTPIAVVGDVHGESGRLRSILDSLATFDGTVVFVGDYVSGGADSKGVLEICTTLSGSERYRFLIGNHDRALLRYVDTGDFARFAATGGVSTLASYLPCVTGDVHAAFMAAIPASHVAFLRSLTTCFETPDCLISHAGFDPARLGARDVETMATANGWPIFGDVRFPRELVVCGHYPQRGGAYESRHLICVDTGCGRIPDAPLSAVLLPERRFLAVR